MISQNLYLVNCVPKISVKRIASNTSANRDLDFQVVPLCNKIANFQINRAWRVNYAMYKWWGGQQVKVEDVG